MNLLKTHRKLTAAVTAAIAEIEQLKHPLEQMIGLIREISALDLPQAEQASLSRAFTHLADQMRASGAVATFAEPLAAFGRLRDAMITAAQTSTVIDIRKGPS